MELSYEDHYQTSVPLLKCDEELIETLEDHQVNILVTDSVTKTLCVTIYRKCIMAVKHKNKFSRSVVCEEH